MLRVFVRMLYINSLYNQLEAIIGHCAITAAHVDVVALCLGCADAATIATESRAAALGLHLIILEHEQVIGANFECRTI